LSPSDNRKKMRIGFIGGGVMADAIVSGILRQGVAQPQDVWISEPVESRRAYLNEQHGVTTTSDNRKVFKHGELVVLAVKPQDISLVLGENKGSLDKDQTVVSIVAGTKMQTIASGLGHESVVRVMPNTPAQIGAGMSVWLAARSVSKAHRQAVGTILGTLGQELEVDEEKYMDMGTALSASGPAYVFLFIESLIDAGIYLGMTREMARTLSLQTVIGSARLVQESSSSPAELREMVSSPGGTTVEALKVLEEGKFRATIKNAIVAAYEKAKRLGE
jgi:pyrroline-5-carboxylate reductase